MIVHCAGCGTPAAVALVSTPTGGDRPLCRRCLRRFWLQMFVADLAPAPLRLQTFATPADLAARLGRPVLELLRPATRAVLAAVQGARDAD